MKRYGKNRKSKINDEKSESYCRAGNGCVGDFQGKKKRVFAIVR